MSREHSRTQKAWLHNTSQIDCGPARHDIRLMMGARQITRQILKTICLIDGT
jgi:hypothetical protein